MRHIREYIKKFYNKNFNNNKSIPLGRWTIDYCNNKINKKIDLSNEDHCGPCGQYNSLYQQNFVKSIVKQKIIDHKKINNS